MHQLSIFQHLIGANVDGVSVFQVVETEPALPPHSNFETLSYLLTINSGLCKAVKRAIKTTTLIGSLLLPSALMFLVHIISSWRRMVGHDN